MPPRFENGLSSIKTADTNSKMTTKTMNYHAGEGANARLTNLLADTYNIINDNTPSNFTIENARAMYETMVAFASKQTEVSNPTARRKINNYLARHTDKVAVVKVVEKDDRKRNDCYINAFKEFNQTGNPMVYGLVGGGSMATDNFFFLVPHCFNYDLKTNTYYDTTPRYTYQSGVKSYPSFLISSQMPIRSAFSLPSKTADEVVGGLVFLTEGEDTYVVAGKNHEGEHLYKQLAFVGKL